MAIFRVADFETRGYNDAIFGKDRVVFSYKNPNEAHYTRGYEKGLQDRINEAYSDFIKHRLVQLELF